MAQRGLLKPLIWRLATVTVLGREQLKDLNGPFVMVSNHSSHLDAPLLIGALPRRLARYVAAGAAADYFFDVWWRKGLTALFFNAFPVDRTGLRGKRGMATSLLDDGVPLLLFPEGTRSRTGEMGNFKPGAAALCISRDVPCVPVALVGASDAMPRGAELAGQGSAAGLRRVRRADASRGRGEGCRLLGPDRQGDPRSRRLRHELPGAAAATGRWAAHAAADGSYGRFRRRGLMTGVKHMKWWGWGVEGVAFHHDDKPAFAPFVSDKVGLDITVDPVVPPELESSAGPGAQADRCVPRAAARSARRGARPDRDPRPDRAHVRQEPARPGSAAAGDHPPDPRCRAVPGRRGPGAGDRRPGHRRGRGDHPVRRRYQHLRQSRAAARGDPPRPLGRPRSVEQGAGHRRRVRAGPHPGRHPRTRPRGAAGRPRLDHGPLPGLVHPLHPRWLGGDPVVGHAVGQVRRHRRHHPRLPRRRARRRAGHPAVAEHRHRTERPGDGPRQRGPPRRHHRGHGAGAPGARGAHHPGLPVPVLGVGDVSHAGDRGRPTRPRR